MVASSGKVRDENANSTRAREQHKADTTHTTSTVELKRHLFYARKFRVLYILSASGSDMHGLV